MTPSMWVEIDWPLDGTYITLDFDWPLDGTYMTLDFD